MPARSRVGFQLDRWGSPAVTSPRRIYVQFCRSIIIIAAVGVLAGCGDLHFDQRGTPDAWYSGGGDKLIANLTADKNALAEAVSEQNAAVLVAACGTLQHDTTLAIEHDNLTPMPAPATDDWNAAVNYLSGAATACLNSDLSTMQSALAAASDDLIHVAGDLSG